MIESINYHMYVGRCATPDLAQTVMTAGCKKKVNDLYLADMIIYILLSVYVNYGIPSK